MGQRVSVRAAVRMALALAISLLCLWLARYPVSASIRDTVWPPSRALPALAQKPQYVVTLILDGGIPPYFHLADFPHLAGLERQGVTYTHAWDGMLESETPTGHAALGTGTLPRHNGIISFGWVQDDGTHMQPTNPIPIQQGQLEDVLKRSGTPSIASALHAQNHRSLVVVTSGHKDYAVDSVGGWAADYMMFYELKGQTWSPVGIPRHVPPASVLNAPGLTAYAPHLAPGDQDSLAVNLAMTAFTQVHQKVTIINLPEFDWPLGHLNGALSDKWLAWKLMTRLDADIGTIERTLKRQHVLSKTLFVLTADHGMETLNHRIPHDLIQNTVQGTGNALDDYEFHTGGYLWLKDHAGAQKVAEALVALNNPLIHAVYYRPPDSEGYVLASGISVPPEMDRAYQFLLNTFAGTNSPHVAIFLKENTGIQGRNQTNWQGDHGGPTWNAEHIPLLLAGAGVRHDVRSSYPATIYDVAPTIVTLLGASDGGMDGVPLNDAFSHPSSALAGLQEKQGAELAPMVQALQDQSKADGP